MSGDAQLGEAWWEAFSAALIPPVQMAIIDALRVADQPMSMPALLEATASSRPNDGPIKHHLTRLRKLNAVEVKVTEAEPERIRYRLAEMPGRVR
jgi:hypothetical protein